MSLQTETKQFKCRLHGSNTGIVSRRHAKAHLIERKAVRQKRAARYDDMSKLLQHGGKYTDRAGAYSCSWRVNNVPIAAKSVESIATTVLPNDVIRDTGEGL